MFPNRTWISIRGKVVQLGLTRNDEAKEIGRNDKAYSPEEDSLIRRFYAGEISQGEIAGTTGRRLPNIRQRARKLGLKWYPQRQPGSGWMKAALPMLQSSLPIE
jgi:hypothetical protein